ncbi:hypothetical protein KIW84_070990 [Lathyrus oleraceus]|uniref:Uncharacterized protein n=1 Tax=Pisum sativum TaxID=3888 RepID=A0A9D4VI95_PEA|nr:hypothetical protein KIW84_070990 [Pisum sativum]
MNKLMHQSSKTQPIRTSKIQQETMTQTLLPPLQAKAAIIGDNVIVGHTVVLQGCIVEDEAGSGSWLALALDDESEFPSVVQNKRKNELELASATNLVTSQSVNSFQNDIKREHVLSFFITP